MPKMKILPNEEKDVFENPPVFSYAERKKYFDFDDIDLRQAIEKQLNKVELANGLTRAVAVGNPREFVQTEKEEQEIAEACNRLIKNSIICWNYLYLTKKIFQFKDSEQKETLKKAIQTHSVLCWEHINLLGEYDFSDEKLKDSIGLSFI